MEPKLPPEVQFAQRLASNNPKIRDKAVKVLAKWFKSRSCGKAIGFEELMVIWKGLFYCMWMSDKPLVQEKLADKLSEMIHCFGQSESVYTFMDVFFQTMAREWYGIDRYRIEKFMMFVRRFLRQSFHFLKQQQWKPKPIRAFFNVLTKSVLNPMCDKTPAALKIHVADVYLEELAQIRGTDFKTKKLLKFLKPYCKFLVETTDPMLLNAISKSVFLELIESEEPLFPFKVKFGLVANLLIRTASDVGVNKDNRDKMYKLVGTFRDASKGIFPSDRLRLDDIEYGRAITKKDIDAAAGRYLDDQSKLRKDGENWKKKKREYAVDEEETEALTKKSKNIDMNGNKRNCNMRNEKISTDYRKSEGKENSRPQNHSARDSQKKICQQDGKLKRTTQSETPTKTSDETRERDLHKIKQVVLPKFVVTKQSKYARILQKRMSFGFVVTPRPTVKETPERVPSTDLSLQKCSQPNAKGLSDNNVESAGTPIYWNGRTSAKTVYAALEKERKNSEELEISVEKQYTNTGSNASSVPTVADIESSMPEINIELKTPKTRVPGFEFKSFSGSRGKSVSFASFEKFVTTPPSFFRKSASKAGAKFLTPTTRGILKKPLMEHSF